MTWPRCVSQCHLCATRQPLGSGDSDLGAHKALAQVPVAVPCDKGDGWSTGTRVQLWWSSLWVPQGLLQLRSSCGHLRRDSAELPAPGHFVVCWDTGNTGQWSAAMVGTTESTTKAGCAEAQPGCGEPRAQKLVGSSLAVAWLEDQAVWGAPSGQSPCITLRSVLPPPDPRMGRLVPREQQVGSASLPQEAELGVER